MQIHLIHNAEKVFRFQRLVSQQHLISQMFEAQNHKMQNSEAETQSKSVLNIPDHSIVMNASKKRRWYQESQASQASQCKQ